MRPLKLGQKGYSLIEAMVTAGLLGITSLYSVKLMEERSLQEYNLRTIADINRTVYSIQKMLNTPQVCTGALAGKRVGGAPLVKLAAPDGSGGEKVYLEANRAYEYFFIPVNGILLRSFGMANFYEVEVTFKIKGRSFGAKQTSNTAADYPIDIVKKIPLIGRVDASDDILECASDMSDSKIAAKEKFCSSIGSQINSIVRWDPVSEKCELQGVSCPVGQIPIRFTSDGRQICGPMANQLNLYDMFDTTPANCVGKPYIQVIEHPTTGKFSINCTVTP